MSFDSSENLAHLITAPPAVDLVHEVEGLHAALQNRDIIGQAKGIIRLLNRCDPDMAFALLGRISQDTNRKLADVAALIAESSAAGHPLPADVAASWRRRTTSGPLRRPRSQAS